MGAVWRREGEIKRGAKREEKVEKEEKGEKRLNFSVLRMFSLIEFEEVRKVASECTSSLPPRITMERMLGKLQEISGAAVSSCEETALSSAKLIVRLSFSCHHRSTSYASSLCVSPSSLMCFYL